MTDPNEPARILFVHPHPDDESIACGGVIARLRSSGHPVTLVTCTGGEEGENLAGIDLGGETLVEHRERELRAALEVLGVTDHRLLGYRDSGMAGTAANDHPDSFHRADLYEAAARLARIVRQVRPAVVVSDDASGIYGHPDHVKAHRVTVRAVGLAADHWWETPADGEPWSVDKRYDVTLSRTRMWAIHQRILESGLPSAFGDAELGGAHDLPFGTVDEVVTTRVDVRPWIDQKRRAMAAHASQIGPDSFFLNLPDDVARDAFGVEEFVLDGAAPGTVEDDLLVGV